MNDKEVLSNEVHLSNQFTEKVSNFVSKLLSFPFQYVRLLKVSKSQKHFFLKLHCPKNEQNIRQSSPL